MEFFQHENVTFKTDGAPLYPGAYVSRVIDSSRDQNQRTIKTCDVRLLYAPTTTYRYGGSVNTSSKRVNFIIPSLAFLLIPIPSKQSPNVRGLPPTHTHTYKVCFNSHRSQFLTFTPVNERYSDSLFPSSLAVSLAHETTLLNHSFHPNYVLPTAPHYYHSLHS